MLYIFRKGEQLGPYSEENIQTFLKIGSVEYTDFVWQEGWNDWKPLAEVFPPSPTPPPLPTPEPKPYQSVRLVSPKDKPTSSCGDDSDEEAEKELKEESSDYAKPTVFNPEKLQNALGMSVLLLGVGSVVIAVVLGLLHFSNLLTPQVEEILLLWISLPYIGISVVVIAGMFVAAVDYGRLPEAVEHKANVSLNKLESKLENQSNKTSILLYLAEVIIGLILLTLCLRFFLDMQGGWLLAVLALVFFAWLLFLPTSIAFRRNIPNRWGVLVINLFFGLTVIGWVIAMVIAVANVKPETKRDDNY